MTVPHPISSTQVFSVFRPYLNQFIHEPLAKKNSAFVWKLPWPELISFLLILILPWWLFPGQETLVILLCIFVAISRASLTYHTMGLELHNLVLLIVAMTYGPAIPIFVGVITLLIGTKLSLYIGLYSPILQMMDTVIITVLGLVGSWIPITLLLTMGLVFLVVIDIIRHGGQFSVFHEPLPKYGIMTVFYFIFTYLIMTNFHNTIIRWVGGSPI